MAAPREIQKQQTRQNLMDAALRLLEEQSFHGLSLREVTREAGVAPTALYRHFPDLEALGVALVDESFQTLRDMLRGARATEPGSWTTRGGAAMVLDYARANRSHFTFLARERFGGVPAIREAIARATDGFAADAAIDLAHSPIVGRWEPSDIRVLADLIATVMTRAVEDTLAIAADDASAAEQILDRVDRQLKFVGAGVLAWHTPTTTQTQITQPDGAR